MALGGIVLSTSMRTTLSSLQSTQEKIGVANERLSTGKRVNSALDDALNYYISEALISRGRQTKTVEDNIGQALKVFEQTDKALSSIKNLLESNAGQLRTAQQAQGTNARFTTYKSFINPVTGAIDGAQPMDTPAATNADGSLEIGDQYELTLGAIGALPAVGPVTITIGPDANDFINDINSNVTLNPVGQEPRIVAYLNDAGQVTVESRDGRTMRLQQVVGGPGVANTISRVFSFGGDPEVYALVSGVAGNQTADISHKTNSTRSTVAATIRNTLEQIEKLARDAGYNGTNLLFGDTMRIGWNADDSTSMITRGIILDVPGLGFERDNPLTTTGDTIYSLQSDDELKLLLRKTLTSIKQVQDLAAAFGTRQNIVQSRYEYTKDTVKILDTGADLLTVADINEEGANLLALQTRQQLGVQALQLAGQSEQAVLRLF
jgi:flagellin